MRDLVARGLDISMDPSVLLWYVFQESSIGLENGIRNVLGNECLFLFVGILVVIAMQVHQLA